MKLILLGAPGAGKGTQADIISRKLEIPTISTGNILRAAVREGTPVGLRAKAIIEAGQLVPDDVIMGIVSERVAKDDCKNGFILDGVPRTIAQADALEEFGINVDCALCIDVPDDVIVRRMSGRRTCSECSATYHVESNPPKTEGICDACGGKLTIRKDDLPEQALGIPRPDRAVAGLLRFQGQAHTRGGRGDHRGHLQTSVQGPGDRVIYDTYQVPPGN